jgi:thiol-disulfide isomerase/thioredoxin
MRIWSKTFIAAAVALATASPAGAESLEGRWTATVTVNGTAIPFRLDLSGDGPSFKGTLFNGDDTQTTTSATHEGQTVVLKLDHYLTNIVATEQDGVLVGRVEMRNDKDPNGSPFRAVRYVAPAATATSANVPDIGGSWVIPHESPKGEKAWRFIVKQKGADVQAAILRVDGDTGALSGQFENGAFVISHFDGSRPSLMQVTPAPDGTLTIVQRGSNRDGTLTAYRPDVARAKGLPEPSDYRTHTTVRDPNERFTFSFPDVTGAIRTQDDPQFKGKAIVAIVTGTWCPNCHDEAQYLVPLYRKYRDQGLEVIALDFEEPEQQDSLARVNAFIAKYGVDYTYLIAGAPAEMWEKVPQAVNLNTWPASFFIGKDGRVKAIHSGFAAPASGEFHEQLKADFTANIERLLADRSSTSTQQDR